MKHRFYEQAAREVTADYSQRMPNELIEEMMALVESISLEVQKLNAAFVPPCLANVIGFLFHPFRQKTYHSLALSREKIIKCAEALQRLKDIDLEQAAAALQKRVRLDELNRNVSEAVGSVQIETMNSLEKIEKSLPVF